MSEQSAGYPLTLKLPLFSCRCNMPVNLITIRALGARYWLLEHILKALSPSLAVITLWVNTVQWDALIQCVLPSNTHDGPIIRHLLLRWYAQLPMSLHSACVKECACVSCRPLWISFDVLMTRECWLFVTSTGAARSSMLWCTKGLCLLDTHRNYKWRLKG